MPKRRVLDYSLDPNQPGESFLFQLVLIALVAIPVNFLASLPGAVRALSRGRAQQPRAGHASSSPSAPSSPTVTDALNRFGSTELYELGKLLGVIFLFAGLPGLHRRCSTEIRIPFTGSRPAHPGPPRRPGCRRRTPGRGGS